MVNYDTTWIVPALRNPVLPRFIWSICSSITVTAVGCLSKLFIKLFNKPKVYNAQVLNKFISRRPENVPLLTVSNHDSCLDDPGIWVSQRWRSLLAGRRNRWSLAAHDICFQGTFHSYFFMLGQCIPIVRGEGVFQDAVNFCIELLSRGEWLHVFPEGKVNMTKEYLRLKWGVGRMIYESPVTPIVIPMWHMGMEDILPNYPPYYPRTGKNLTINVGEPIDFNETVKQLRAENASEERARKVITDMIQIELFKLRQATENLHKKYNS